MTQSLAEQWMGLAGRQASLWRDRLTITQEDYEDLISEAYLVLVESEKTYKPEQGAFSTFVMKNIKNKFEDLLAAKYQIKRAKYTTYSFSSMLKADDQDDFEEVYCSVPETFTCAVEIHEELVHFAQTCSPAERYLMEIRRKEQYTGEEVRVLYAKFVGKDPEKVNISREVAKLRKKYTIYQEKRA